MGLETGIYIDDLIDTNPLSTDKRRFGDDHLRLIKSVLKNSFPTIDGSLDPTLTELNYSVGLTDAIQDQLDAKLDPEDIENSAEKDEQNTFTQGQATEEVEITFASVMAPDASLSNAFRIALTNNFTLNQPINGIPGQVLTIFLEQDDIGDRVMTFGTTYYGSTTDDLVLSTGVDKVDLLTLLFGAISSRWYVAGLKKDIDNAL